MAVFVTFVDSTSVSRTVEVELGVSVMKAAVDNDVPEVQSECGGACTCAACHVYVDPAYVEQFDQMGAIESGLLSLLESRKETSRLSCQLKMTEERDGAIIYTLDPGVNN